MNKVSTDIATIAEATSTTVDSWDLAGDTEVVVFADGTVNALLADGTAVYDLAAGDDDLTATLAKWAAAELNIDL